VVALLELPLEGRQWADMDCVKGALNGELLVEYGNGQALCYTHKNSSPILVRDIELHQR